MDENPQPEQPADFTGDGEPEDALAKIDAISQEQPSNPPPESAASQPDSGRLTFQRVWKQIQEHRAIVIIAGVLVFIGATLGNVSDIVDVWNILTNYSLIKEYPYLATNTPLPTVTTAPTAQPTTTPIPTRTPLPSPTPLAFRPAAEGETLIVIARFVYLEGADDTDPAGEIALSIRAAAKELDFNALRVEVEPTQIGRLARPEAEALGRQYGAAIVIWGQVSTAAVTTNFLNLSEPEFPAAVLKITLKRRRGVRVWLCNRVC